MATFTVAEYANVEVSSGIWLGSARFPELKTTDIDTASATTLVLSADTNFVVIVCRAGPGRISGKAAIGAGNVGEPMVDGNLRPAFAAPGSTLYFG